jgi:hypothetical protein
MVSSVSVFCSGPSSLVVVVFVAFQLRNEPWMPWVIGGAIAGVVMMLLTFASTFRKAKELGEKNVS